MKTSHGIFSISEQSTAFIAIRDCVIVADPEYALEQMFSTKEMWGKTDGRQFKHFVQSFPPDEEVFAETVHTIGIKFSEKMFPGFEVVIATHTDKDHCHNHIIFNSVSFKDRKKYHSPATKKMCRKRKSELPKSG